MTWNPAWGYPPRWTRPWTPLTIYGGGWVPPQGGQPGMFGAWSVKAPTPAWWLNRGGYCGGYWGGYGLPGYPYCPNIFVGGSCCSGCAEGKGCKGEEHGPPMVSALTVSAEERNEMQAQVIQFVSDVDKAEALESQDRAKNFAAAAAANACWSAGLTWQENHCVQVEDPTHQSFKNIPGASFAVQLFRQERLAPFLALWTDYQTGFGSSIGVATFEELKLSFQNLVSDWKGMGQQTAAIPPKVTTSGITDPLAKGFAGAAEGIAKVATYAVALGAVGLGLYFVGPPLLAAVMRKKRAA